MKAVLIIEDNPTSMEMLARIVNEVDPEITVHRAVNQNEAYAAAMKVTMDLFLVDIILDTKNPGDVSGVTFANRIRMVDKYKYAPHDFYYCAGGRKNVCLQRFALLLLSGKAL